MSRHPTAEEVLDSQSSLKYDQRGFLIERAGYRTNGSPVYRYTYEYDGQGNRIGWATFGTNGAMKSIVASQRFTSGNSSIRICWRIADEAPVVPPCASSPTGASSPRKRRTGWTSCCPGSCPSSSAACVPPCPSLIPALIPVANLDGLTCSNYSNHGITTRRADIDWPRDYKRRQHP